MNPSCSSMGPPPEYERALADLERRAALGEVTLLQARQEIFALREKYAGGLPLPAGTPGAPH